MLLLNLRIACRDTFEASLLPGSVRCGRQPSKSLQRALCCTMLGQVSCWKHAEILVNQTWLRYQRALVTGGLRGLGLRVAKWLADNGRSHRSPSSVCHFVSFSFIFCLFKIFEYVESFGRAKSLVLMGRNQSQGWEPRR